MNALAPFRFDDMPVRIEDRDGAPWFVLADICRVLGIANVADAAARLDADERDEVGLADAIGREQQTTVVNESGLYRLVLRSRKAAARRFSKWVTGEVLPTIRRTGGYGLPPAPNLDDNATLRALLLGKLDQVEAAQAEAAALQSKATALDRLADTGGALCVSDAAKTLGVQPKRLFHWLMANDWIYRRGVGGPYTIYQSRLDAGLMVRRVTRITRTDGSTKLAEQVMVTPKGLTKLATLIGETKRS